MEKHGVICSHCQRDTCVLDEEQELVVSGISYAKVPPGVYKVPARALGEFAIGQLPPHSSIRVTGLPPLPPEYECYLLATNAGDANDDDYLSILAELYLAAEDNRQARLARIRKAYSSLVDEGELAGAYVPPTPRDSPKLAASFKIDLAGHPQAIVREQIEPILELLKRIGAA